MSNKNKDKLFTQLVIYADGYNQEVKFKHKKSFDEIKNNIMYSFNMGAYEVHLYYDARKNDFIVIKEEDYSEDEILEGYRKIDIKHKLKNLNKKKNMVLSNIENNKNKLLEIENEISKLE